MTTTVAITCSRSLCDHPQLISTFSYAMARLQHHFGIKWRDAYWVHGNNARGDRDLVAFLQDHADANGWTVEAIDPDYGHYPPHVAPLERNSVLVERADALVAIWKPPFPGAQKKGGTFDTICKGAAKGIPVVVEVLT
jgi:hypothetical protein